MANAKCSVKRDSLIELESYIEQAYNTTVNMSDNRQARMDVALSKQLWGCEHSNLPLWLYEH